MKLLYTFENVNLDGEIMAVPVGDNSENLHGMLRLNETAAFILDCLKEDTTEEKIVDKILTEYEGDRNEIAGYVSDYIAELKQAGVISEDEENK